MNEIRIAFYKYPKSIVNRVISGWTWIFNMGTPPYSHVEIGFFVDGEWRYFSSSMPDNGTRWKSEKDLFKHPERWDVYASEFEPDAIEAMIKRAGDNVGKKYDKLGIFGFVTLTGLIANKRDHWYCSEICTFILTGRWVKRISPRRFFKWIIILYAFKLKEEEDV